VPGLSVLAIRGGKIIAQGAAGVRRVGFDEPVTLDDLWHIGSCSKAMTATLAARLVENDTLKWSSTIGECLGDVDGLSEQVLSEYKDVTLRELLSHRSGLPDDRNPNPEVWMPVMALNGPIMEQRVKAAGIVLSRKAESEPGTKMAYSNFGYVIAGVMMEQVTGESWEDLMTTQVFKPLGMTTAGFGAPGADDKQSATATQPWGHQWTGDANRPIEPWLKMADNPALLRPAGGIHVSLNDWAKFAAAHLAGGLGGDEMFHKAESWRMLHVDAYKQQYSMGWVVGQRPWAGGVVLSHMGSNRKWMRVIWLAPKRDLTVIAVTNTGSPQSAGACDEAVGAALRETGMLGPKR